MKKIEGYKEDSYSMSAGGILEWNTKSGFMFEVGDSVVIDSNPLFKFKDFVVSQCFGNADYIIITGKVNNSYEVADVDDSMIVQGGVIVSSVGFPFMTGVSINVRETIEANMNYSNQEAEESEGDSETEEKIVEGEKEIYGDSENDSAETESF